MKQPPEPWLDKRELAAHYSCSVRSIQTALTEGIPHAVIFGRVKFKVSQCEPWLEEHGYLVRCGDSDYPEGRETEAAGRRANAPDPDTRR
jgi:hypothetical protein